MAIGRASRFSPNSVGKDAAILDSVCNELAQMGCVVETVRETDLGSARFGNLFSGTLCLSMGRSGEVLALLREMEESGCTVINSSASVALCCNRRRLTDLLRQSGVPVPAEEGAFGYWLKRADGVAEGPGDVRFAADVRERAEVREAMRLCGVGDIIVSAHVPGDLVKFYGVRGSQFFRTFYPGDDGQWKFGDEWRNGRPQHYPFSVAALHSIAERAADVTGTDVYGGDCIVRADGSVSIVDFNDWPSFSRCRDEAAAAIAEMACVRMGWVASENCEKKII